MFRQIFIYRNECISISVFARMPVRPVCFVYGQKLPDKLTTCVWSIIIRIYVFILITGLAAFKLLYTYMCEFAKYGNQLEYKNRKKFVENTPTRQGFSGSLGILQHENTRELHGLAFAKLFCRPNEYQNFFKEYISYYWYSRNSFLFDAFLGSCTQIVTKRRYIYSFTIK